MSATRSRRSSSALAAVAAVALVCGACSGGQDYGSRTKLQRPRDYGRAQGGGPGPTPKTPTARPSLRPLPTDGTIVVTVTDGSGRARSDIPVTYARAGGPAATVFTSGGRARARLRAGYYALEVPVGCSTLVIVSRGDGGHAGVAAGQTLKVRLTVEAQRRYWPIGGSDPRPDPPWSLGEAVRFRYRITDRCTTVDAPGASLAGLAYRASSGIELIDRAPTLVGDDSFATVRFRCVRRGDATLYLVDPENPADRQELLRLTPPFDPTTKLCG